MRKHSEKNTHFLRFLSKIIKFFLDFLKKNCINTVMKNGFFRFFPLLGIISAFGIYFGLRSVPAFSTPACEKAWQSPAQKAQELFQNYQAQMIQGNIPANIHSIHLKPLSENTVPPPSIPPSSKLRVYNGEIVFLKPLKKVFNFHNFKHEQIGSPISENLLKGLRELAVYRTLQDLQIPTLFLGVTSLKKELLNLSFSYAGTEAGQPRLSKMRHQGWRTNTENPSSEFESAKQEEELFMVLKFQEGDTLHLDKRTHTDWFMNRTGHIQMQTIRDLKKIKELFLKYHILPRDFQILVSKDGRAYIFDVEYYEFLGDSSKSSLNGSADQTQNFKTDQERYQLIQLYFEELAIYERGWTLDTSDSKVSGFQ